MRVFKCTHSSLIPFTVIKLCKSGIFESKREMHVEVCEIIGGRDDLGQVHVDNKTILK